MDRNYATHHASTRNYLLSAVEEHHRTAWYEKNRKSDDNHRRLLLNQIFIYRTGIFNSDMGYYIHVFVYWKVIIEYRIV